MTEFKSKASFSFYFSERDHIMEEIVEEAKRQSEYNIKLRKFLYRNLINRILEQPVNPPENLTSHDLMDWLNGYACCQNEINEMME